ncbi:MAG: AsmA-like C-terminal region-containing protein, partial [Flavobacteriales bacterium]
LSLVPAVFKRDFESVQTAGKLSLDGFVKGTSSDEAIPGFGLNLKVEDAMFKYPDLPKAARNIQVALNINNPGGSADQTLIDLKKFHAEVAGQPLNMTLHLATPISDPDMDMNVKSQINLSNLRDVIPMEEGEQYSGMLTADLNLKGKLSAIEKERYDNFHAAGKIILLDMKSSDPDSYDISVKKMSLNFSPRFVELAAFESVINKSDVAATGKILNILGWYFKDENLTGRFDMQSRHLDLNAFTTEDEDIPEAGEEAELAVIEVPKNLDFTLNTNMGELIFENLTMKDVSGEVILRDGKAILKHLRMKALDGSMDVSGTYSTLNPERPSVDFDVDISHVDIKKTYDTFESVQKMAPIAEHCTGKISTDMVFSTELDAHMEPIMDKMTGKGHLKTDHVVVNNSGVFSKIADVLKMDQYRKMDLDNVNFTYEFKDGRVVVDPFEMPVSHGKANVNGSSGFDQTLSYVMQLDVPVTDVGTAGMRVVNGLVSQANSAGANFSVGDRVNLSLIIGGTTLNPTVKPHYGKSSDGAAEGIKEQAIEKVEEVKEQVKEEVKQNIKEQAEKILNEAKKKADAIRAEAKRSAEKFRSEGYANARKVEDQAGNPLAKIAAKKTADKMRSETDKKADQIIAEGNKKADAVMDAARKRVDQLK